MSDSLPAIHCHNIHSGYRKKEVLHGVSFQFPTGSTIGLLGPNGAGKSTLINLLNTVRSPQEGEISIQGLNPSVRQERDKIRQSLGYLPQNFTVDEQFTVHEFITYSLWMRQFAKDKREEATHKAIEQVGLSSQSRIRIKELSGGMRQRAGIAASIAGNPSIILLDEPTVGLDPDQRYSFRELLNTLKEQDNPPTVLLSTHLVEDLASCATHLLLLKEGKVQYEGTAEVLTASDNNSIDSLEKTYRELLNATHNS